TKIRIQVPQEPNSFVGRERELTELSELLGVTRALTLCGPGGIGKTRLAQHVMHTVAGSFPDGGCFVDLGELWAPDLGVSPGAGAARRGAERRGGPLPAASAGGVPPRRVPRARDTCGPLIDGCAAVPQRLLAASPGVILIPTSREPLRVAAETVWQVPPLSV